MVRLLRPRTLLAVMLVLILSVAVYGFTATNTVPATAAGDGSNTISGYAITNVDYNLDPADPSEIDTVTFTINPTSADTVLIRLVNPAGAWYPCVNAAGSVTCTTNAPVLTANELRVVATD